MLHGEKSFQGSQHDERKAFFFQIFASDFTINWRNFQPRRRKKCVCQIWINISFIIEPRTISDREYFPLHDLKCDPSSSLSIAGLPMPRCRRKRWLSQRRQISCLAIFAFFAVSAICLAGTGRQVEDRADVPLLYPTANYVKWSNKLNISQKLNVVRVKKRTLANYSIYAR